jgi:hypothetical protein
VFLRWCTDQDLDPLSAAGVDIERYLRWLQDVRRYQPSTVSRRLSVVVGFSGVCVIDQLLPHSPADYVRRPTVPAESPTLGLGHLQFEALIITAPAVGNPNDFALVARWDRSSSEPSKRSFTRPRSSACCRSCTSAGSWPQHRPTIVRRCAQLPTHSSACGTTPRSPVSSPSAWAP